MINVFVVLECEITIVNLCTPNAMYGIPYLMCMYLHAICEVFEYFNANPYLGLQEDMSSRTLYVFDFHIPTFYIFNFHNEGSVKDDRRFMLILAA